MDIWNIRGINGKEDELIEEIIIQKLDYLGITETKKKKAGIQVLREGYMLIWSGVEEAERAAGGVALLINPYKIKFNM